MHKPGLRSLLGPLLMAAALETQTVYNDGPKGNRDISKPSTLNTSQKSKRTKRNKLAKQSRKQNRR
jgi:hypothetical protein